MAVYYVALDVNMETCTTLKAKIAKIDAIIDSLLTTALKSVGNGDTVEYTLDDGQTKINKVYSSTASVTNAIQEYEKIRIMYVNRLQGRHVRLVDSKNFRR